MNILETENSELFYDKFNNMELLENCINEIQDKLTEYPKSVLYNRIITFNRCIGFFSDVSLGYKYSNQIQKSLPLTDNLKKLLLFINEKYETEFNAILINKYNDGNDYISKHSDNENYLDKMGILAISYGATRIFRIRKKKDNKIIKDINIQSGDIIIMKGDFQKVFTHEIPIQKKIIDCRYSFTFRKHLI